MKQGQKLDYIDGLKVLASLMVFNFHFIHFFYCGFYSLAPADFHTGYVEAFVGSTPLNIVMGAKFAVRIFLTISGFFVGYRFFATGDKRSLSVGVVKKYFRLVFPILTVSIAIYACMKLGLYRNGEASLLAGSQVFAGNYNQFEPTLFGAVKEALWGCFATGENQYNGPIWFMHYEFFGTLMVAAILSLLGNSKARYAVYVVAGIIFIRSDFLALILGALICDFTYRPPVWVKKLSEQKWLMWTVFLSGLFLGSYPPIGERLEGTIYGWIPAKVMFYYVIGAACLFYGLLHLKRVQKILSLKILTRMFKYTYAFYLVHFLVLCTFSCSFYLALNAHVNYHLLAVMNYVLSLGITWGLSYLIYHLVEKPGNAFASSVAEKFCNE